MVDLPRDMESSCGVFTSRLEIFLKDNAVAQREVVDLMQKIWDEVLWPVLWRKSDQVVICVP